MAGGAVDAVQLSFSPSGLRVLNACLALVMFGVALGIRVEDFVRLVRAPRPVLAGLLSQWVALPLVTLGLVLVAQPPPSIALGLVLVSACPGGNISNFLVHLGGGNAALSVSLTSLSSLASAVVTPLVFSAGVVLLGVAGGGDGVPALSVDLVDVGVTIALVVLLPLALGVGVAARWPARAAALEPVARWVSLLVFALFVALAIAANLSAFRSHAHHVVLLVVAHNALALTSGWLVGRAFGLEVRDRRAVMLETGIQNSGLALVLIFGFFSGLGGMALVAAMWGVWHILSGLAVATWQRRHPAESSGLSNSA